MALFESIRSCVVFRHSTLRGKREEKEWQLGIVFAFFALDRAHTAACSDDISLLIYDADADIFQRTIIMSWFNTRPDEVRHLYNIDGSDFLRKNLERSPKRVFDRFGIERNDDGEMGITHGVSKETSGRSQWYLYSFRACVLVRGKFFLLLFPPFVSVTDIDIVHCRSSHGRSSEETRHRRRWRVWYVRWCHCCRTSFFF